MAPRHHQLRASNGVATNLGMGQGPWLDVAQVVMLFMKTRAGRRLRSLLRRRRRRREEQGLLLRLQAEEQRALRDEATAKKLWDVSEKLTGVVYPS
jgi:hypothetical protein